MGRSIRMDILDQLTTQHLADRLLVPDRLTEMLTALIAGRAEKASMVDDRIGRLEQEAEQARARPDRLYTLIDDGPAEVDDVLKGQINELKLEFERARSAQERARTAVRPEVQVCPTIPERFGTMMREILTTGAVPVPKAVTRSLVDHVEVDDDEIRIVPDKAPLERAALGCSGIPTAENGGVPSLVRDWRTSWVQIANPYVLLLISDLPFAT